MGAEALAQGAKRILGAGFRRIFSISLITIFLTIILLHAIIVGIEQRNPWAGIEDIGSRLITTTEALNEDSLKVIEKGTVYEDTGGMRAFFKAAWVYIALLSSIFVILTWVKLLARGIGLFNVSGTAINYLFAIIVFIFLQWLFLFGRAVSLAEPANIVDLSLTPFVAFLHFGQALPFLIEPFVGIAERFSGSG